MEMNLKNIVAAVKSALNFNDDESGQLNVMMGIVAIIGVVIAAAFLIVGIVVIQSMLNGANIQAGDELYNTSQNMITSMDSAFSMSGIVLIVIISTAILGMLVSVLGLIAVFGTPGTRS